MKHHTRCRRCNAGRSSARLYRAGNSLGALRKVRRRSALAANFRGTHRGTETTKTKTTWREECFSAAKNHVPAAKRFGKKFCCCKNQPATGSGQARTGHGLIGMLSDRSTHANRSRRFSSQLNRTPDDSRSEAGLLL